ncbi:RICIN domain-containing protein [Krasilnikovia sp. M28-CT-15]|uniref:RICIN domain-containing protein n=1 Tax=Krasilnikovia sp. M28-CT-15 TaxID=3373540 RepID=UPI0038762983
MSITHRLVGPAARRMRNGVLLATALTAALTGVSAPPAAAVGLPVTALAGATAPVQVAPARAAVQRVSAAMAPPIVEPGRTYYIRSRLNWHKCIEMPGWSKKNYTQADIWTCVNQNNVKWKVVFAGTYGGLETYFIKNVHSGKCLNLAGDSPKDGAKIIQYKCNTGLNNMWRFLPHQDYLEVKSMSTNGLLNISGGRAVNKAKIIQWNRFGYKNQDFFFDLA